MKLLSFYKHKELRLGALLDHRILDLAQAVEAYRLTEGGKVDDRNAAGFPSQMLGFLQGGEELLHTAQATVEWAGYPEVDRITRSMLIDLVDARLAPPLSSPGKIICVGLNYLDHCREQNIGIPEKPILFAKFPSAVIGPQEAITWQASLTSQVDYEAELAVIVGKKASHIKSEDAYKYIAGYTVVNDVSARDLQFGDGQWVRGKSLDSFCPMGPFLVTVDEIPDPHDLDIRCWIDEQLLQDSNTSSMIFKIPQLLEFISQAITLFPGDVICTGTPHGVGVFRKPPVFLKKGNQVRVYIEKVGELCNPVDCIDD